MRWNAASRTAASLRSGATARANRNTSWSSAVTLSLSGPGAAPGPRADRTDGAAGETGAARRRLASARPSASALPRRPAPCQPDGASPAIWPSSKVSSSSGRVRLAASPASGRGGACASAAAGSPWTAGPLPSGAAAPARGTDTGSSAGAAASSQRPRFLPGSAAAPPPAAAPSRCATPATARGAASAPPLAPRSALYTRRPCWGAAGDETGAGTEVIASPCPDPGAEPVAAPRAALGSAVIGTASARGRRCGLASRTALGRLQGPRSGPRGGLIARARARPLEPPEPGRSGLCIRAGRSPYAGQNESCRAAAAWPAAAAASAPEAGPAAQRGSQSSLQNLP